MRNNLRTIRKKKGVSQIELAVAVGMKQNSISSLETQTYNPTLKHAMMIAGVLCCSVYDIWKLDPEDWDGTDPAACWLDE